MKLAIKNNRLNWFISQPAPVISCQWILVAIILVVAPHFNLVSLPIMLFFSSLIIWRFIIIAHNWKNPGKIIRLTIAVFAIILVFTSTEMLLTKEVGISLLVAMLGVKLLEMKNQRDLYIVALIAYFFVITHFFYSQSILMALYMLFVVLFVTATLIDLNTRCLGHDDHSNHYRLIANLKTAGVLLLQALPFMILLFYLFPRIASPLWGISKDTTQGVTGLSDQMTPGQISKLSQSDALAFRVEFDSTMPPPAERYWRGPVLWYTDGYTWKTTARSKTTVAKEASPVFSEGEAISYTITLEAHNKKWLYGLDIPFSGPDFAWYTADYQMQSEKIIQERIRYRAQSYTQYKMHTLSHEDRLKALQLPAGKNPKTLALGQALRKQYQNDEPILAQVLKRYRQQTFVYTLQPPLLNNEHPMDLFLFESKRGFCEHYASSFTLLMRAAGIPARIVTGYQGGEENTIGHFLTVRQRDAHAWAEIWLEGRGWVRVDPTAAVAPERVERSIFNELGREGDAIRFILSDHSLATAIAHKLLMSWETLNNSWNSLVLNYDQQQQQNFLEKLGLDAHNWQNLLMLLMLGMASLVGLLVLIILVRKNKKAEPVKMLWQLFCRKLAKKGIVYQANEGPISFAQRIARIRPELSAQTNIICQQYCDLQYGNKNSAIHIKTLQQTIRSFKP